MTVSAHRARQASRGRWRSVILVVVVVTALGGLGAWVAHTSGISREGDGGGAPSFGSARAAQSGAATDLVQVSGRQGATPVVTVSGPLDVVDPEVRELVRGEGREITRGSSVVLAITAFDGADGTILSPQGRPQLRVGRADEKDLGAELAGQVVGRTEGSRLVFVRRVAPSQSGGPRIPSGIEVDVVDVLASVATGREQPSGADEAQGPLTVTLGDEGPIISHQGGAPSDLATQILVRGDGEQVSDEDAVVAQFIVTGWSDGIVRSSTWSTGVPQSIDLATAMPGLRDALVDQRVGSRIAVTIPPDQASGDDTLCAVVDILGTEPARE